MPAKKYQVFVSSTFRDLVEERRDAIINILDLNHIPAGMELFPAADSDQLVYIKKVIDECDYYLLIIGGRYGSMDENGISYTEREYDYAVEKGMVVLAFVHDDLESIPLSKSDIKPEVVAALGEFRTKVVRGRLVKTWSSRQQLEPLVLKALMHAFNNMPQVGWIRGSAAASEQLLEQSNAVLQESAVLRAELTMLKAIKPVVFENLADLDESFTIRYRTQYWHSTAGYIYTDRTTALTWREIFLSLAAQLTTSKTDSVIFPAVKVAMQEAGNGQTPIEVNVIDIATIKAQFAALGLITVAVSNALAGGVAEFMTLTPKGRATYMENMVVRKSQGAIPD